MIQYNQCAFMCLVLFLKKSSILKAGYWFLFLIGLTLRKDSNKMRTNAC